jgi:hypothetical protein
MKKINVFIWLIYFFSNRHKCTLGIDSYVCIVLNPVDKFRLEWCKGCIFSHKFSCEKNTSFAPSEPVLSMLGWYDYTTFNICFFLKYFLVN